MNIEIGKKYRDNLGFTFEVMAEISEGYFSCVKIESGEEVVYNKLGIPVTLIGSMSFLTEEI